MKRIPLLITIGIVLVIAGGYYLYDKVLTKKPIPAWDIIPRDAVLVYEKDDCQSCIDDIQKSSLWRVIERAAFYSKPVDSLTKSLQTILKDQQEILISLHATKKDDFDFIFYANASLVTSNQFADLTLNNKRYRISERIFNAVKIHEVNFSKQVFSWALIDNNWIGSFTPFLIEDVIRTSKSDKSKFRNDLTQLQQMPRINGDAGNLYVKLNSFAEWISLFTNDQVLLAESFGKASILDIKSDNNTLVLNGFSIDTVDKSKFVLSIFSNQSPVSFNLKHVVSNQTIGLSAYGISNGKLFKQDLVNFGKRKKFHSRDSLQLIAASLKINFDNLYNSIHDEIGVCFLEPSRGKEISKIMLIETDQPQEWLDTFSKLSDKFSVDTVFYERFAGYEIREVPLYKFPEKMFWPLVSGFDQSFYTVIGNIVVIGENLDELKKILLDIDDEDTWGKSVAQNRFLETTLLESNISIYLNTAKMFNAASNSLQPRWQQFTAENRALIRSLQMSAIQFSHLNNSYYTNISVTSGSVSSSPGNDNKRNRVMANFSIPVSALYAVKSHVNKSDEILTQDSLNNLTLLSNDGEVLWTLSLNARIVSEVHQIDYYGNGKLQYCFATSNAIYVIDRLGNYVQPYPLMIASSSVEHISVIDYDHSRNYRFLVSDKEGKLWMFDKEGNNLEGWQPKIIQGSLLTPAKHHRIKGKDYIIAIKKDGWVHLMNRKGEDIKGFPLHLESKLAGDYFLDAGTTLQDTYFVVVSEDGFRIRFTPTGKVQSKETLLKTSFNTQFSLISEKRNKSYVIVQRDSRQFNILDESGKKIISNSGVGNNSTVVNYYDFPSGKTCVSIADITQGLTYVYDGQGNLISTPPLESALVEIRPLDSEQIRVFFIHGNRLTIQPLGY